MLSINTNLSSLITQSSLKESTNKLNLAIERMSTGFKVNHAKDNAANYSILTNMTTKINSYMVAEDNAAMGLDMISTAEGTLSQIQDKLSRLRALAEQSANGTYGEQSKQAINAEAVALTDELYRIMNSASFNSQRLFGVKAGVDKSRLAVNNDGFIEDISRQNTDLMTTIASVDESAILAKGTYSISSADELEKLARMQNSGKITAGSEFVLANDIDLSGVTNWTPIGFESGNLQTNYAFSGTFDGNGYIISNLTSTQNNTSATGLFGTVDNATFKNIGVKNVVLQGNIAGSLVGCIKDNSNITVENCYSTEVNITIIGSTRVSGGLIGGKGNSAHIDRNTSACVTDSYAKVTINNGYWSSIGGIIGTVDDISIKDCFSEFEINSIDSVTGGIVGNSLRGNIENCFTTGTVNDTGVTAGQAGGIGGGDLSIYNCSFEGNLYCQGGYIGGILSGCSGEAPVYIEGCSVKADLSAKVRIGGIAGWMDGQGGWVKNCSFEGTLEADTDIGSMVGGGVDDLLLVENCSYNKSLLGNISAIGDGLGTARNILDNIRKTTLQVGINGNDHSQLYLDCSVELSNISSLRLIGLDDEGIIKTIDKINSEVSEKQTELGALSDRLNSVIEEIVIQRDNLVSSRSTIRDADIAEVSASYIQQQILQQASATLLATANQNPSVALQLI